MQATEDQVFRVMRTMSRTEVTVRYWVWAIINLVLLGALVGNAVLFAATCHGAVSPWAMPFVLAFGLWLVMAGPRAGERWWLYSSADLERMWWDEWRERNELPKDGAQ